jgi:hypothetical protein
MKDKTNNQFKTTTLKTHLVPTSLPNGANSISSKKPEGDA